IQKSLRDIQSDRFTLSVYFGRNFARKYDRLSNYLFREFPAPLLRVQFVKRETWEIRSVQVVAMNDIPEDHQPFVLEAIEEYFKSRKRPVRKQIPRYDMAILVNPPEKEPPSDAK